MNALAAIGTGAGIGLAYYGGLWFTLPARHFGITLTLSRLTRLALLWIGFYALMAEGIAFGLAGLAGLLLVRWHLVRRWGGPDLGRG